MNSFKDYPRHEKNPFLKDSLDIKTVNKTISVSHRPITLNENNGKETTTAFVHIKRVRDKEKFSKIYPAFIHALYSLSQRATHILFYFVESLQQNSDKVFFNMEECKGILGYSTHIPIYKGMAELIEKGIIAKADSPNVYYINPKMVFNGDRLIIVNEFIKGNESEENTGNIIEMQPNKNFLSSKQQ